ncbi:MAG: sigma 54-interacting transcriptional regulator, partial [Myxococcota bacterium]
MTTPTTETRDETLDEDDVARRGPSGLQVLVAWCREDPSRVGEVVDVDTGRTCVIGRVPGEDAAAFVRRRPGRDERRGPLTESRLSRRHLRLTGVDRRWIEVERLGRNSVVVDGRALEPGEACRVGAGTRLKVAGTLLLWVTPREQLTGDGYRLHAFGEPDAHGIVGEGAATWKLRETLAFVAARRGHVLVRGESGTGKELTARALHEASSRKDGAFVSRNAATVPQTLIDAEMFGNVRNYPNPGMADRPGLVGAADGGTLFLDEVGELPESLQTHLLRLLDQGEYQRLGESDVRTADLRVIGATNRPMTDLRADLQARFSLKVTLPPLRERRSAIPLILRFLARSRCADDPELARRVLDEAGEPHISIDFVDALLGAPLPTNVRQIEGLLWEAVAATLPGDALDVPRAAAEPE